MVLLIGGVSNTGKTLFANHLMARHRISYMSIDHIKMGLYRGDPNCGFTPLDDSVELGQKLWPIIKGIIMTNIENRQNIIIEGCYLLPHLVNDFEQSYLDHIVSIFLGFSDNYIRSNHAAEIDVNRSAIEDKDDIDTVDQMLSDTRKLRSACFENNSNYFEITADYRNEIAAVVQYIDERVSALKHTLKTIAT